MTTQWQTAKLKEVCSRITVGHVGSMADQYRESGIPFLRSLNIAPFRVDERDLKFIDRRFHEKLRKSALRPGDVGVVRTGYPGTACVIPERLSEANCSDLVVMTPGPGLNAHFLVAIFNSTFGKDLVGGNLVGAAQQHFNVTVAKELKLRLPPRFIQDKIAAILSAYNDLIEANACRIALLEKMSEELYREWFVRMRFPGHQCTKFKKGVPESWETKRLGDILELAYGKALKAADREPGPFHVFGSGGVVGSHSKALVTGQGIVVGRKGNVGAVFFSDRGFFPIDTVFYVVSDLPLTYLYFVLRSMNFINNDAAVPGLNRNQAYSNQLFFPDSDLIAKFSVEVEPLFEMKHQLQSQNENLARTRDLLLPRLISGKLSVEELEIQSPLSMAEEVAESEAARA